VNGRATILVVDDTAANRKLLVDLLETHGYATVTAASGEEALAKIASIKPDMVLLDVMMPGISGYDVCKQIRANPENGILPVVMVTSLDPTQERIKGLQAGADDFLTKPINRPEMLARVKSMLRIKSFSDTVQQQAAELAVLNTGLSQRVQEQVGQLERLGQLKRFFAPQLAERIVSGDLDDPLKTRRREVIVVFLDSRGFTAFADTSEPEEVMGLLRTYHGEMGKLIDAYQGTLEQFTADTMMVIFNDPVIVEDPAIRAVRMALDMQQRFAELMTAWLKRGHDIALSIGVAHGYATIGTIGYETRMGYGVIGRVTNLAARLCSVAQRGQILASLPVFELVEAVVEAEDLGQVDLKGFARPVVAYGITGVKSAPVKLDAPSWPLKIYTLGQFALLHDGKPLALSRKVQKRPLDLLKLLVASSGVGVETSALIELLWPDAEGDAAQASFDSTLYRLRKLIGIDGVIVLSEGKLSLESGKCWLDTWEFEKLLDSAERTTELAEVENFSKELLRLYAGHFLEKESQESWAISARDKIKAKFTRAVAHLGAQLEQAQHWPQAIALYSRALELDNLAEGLYRRLMICHRENGEPAEGLNVFRRCRDMLSIVLGVKPSAETEAIRGTLGG
jgi:adenylate cyclase